MIDVSEILSSPELTQTFTVYRKIATWNQGTLVQTEEVLSFEGIINNATQKEIFQIPEGDRIGGMMVFYSSSEIFTTRAWGSQGTDEYGTSDELEWQGDRYRVKKIDNWRDYGYYKAYAVYMQGV